MLSCCPENRSNSRCFFLTFCHSEKLQRPILLDLQCRDIGELFSEVSAIFVRWVCLNDSSRQFIKKLNERSRTSLPVLWTLQENRSEARACAVIYHTRGFLGSCHVRGVFALVSLSPNDNPAALLRIWRKLAHSPVWSRRDHLLSP